MSIFKKYLPGDFLEVKWDALILFLNNGNSEQDILNPGIFQHLRDETSIVATYF